MKKKQKDHSESDDYKKTIENKEFGNALLRENDSNFLKGDDERDSCLSHLPQIICMSVFAIIIFECIFNFDNVSYLYNEFIDWIRVNPYMAIIVIVLFYVLQISTTFPIIATHAAIGFTYS
jgi:hypothetical protein